MSKFLIAIIFTGFAAFAAAGEYGEITADRVNVRVRPDLYSEVVGQLGFGDLVSVESVEDGWAKIIMPKQFSAWVHRDFVENNQVVANALNVRGGPGINYQVVYRAPRGTVFEIRQELGEWLEIAPPEGSVVYVAANLVKTLPRAASPAALPEVGDAEVLPPPVTVQPVQPQAVREDLAVDYSVPPPPEHLNLIPLAGQGRETKQSGILLKVGFLFGRPADYRLVKNDGDFQRTICYIHASKEDVHDFLGSTVDLEGHEYWYEGGRLPVVVPTRIQARSLRPESL